MTREEAIIIAAEALKTTVDEIKENVKEVPEIEGFYIWQNARGGNSVIIDSAGERLRGTSAVSFERHLEAFKNGKRN